MKDAVADAGNSGKVIVLTGDIIADIKNPINSVGGADIVIDGGGFTITGEEGIYYGQFIIFDKSDTTDLIIQNVTFKEFGIDRGYDKSQGGGLHNFGTIGNITSDFFGNYVHSYSGSAYAQGGAIYNSGTIDNISGTFTSNHAKSSFGYAQGGAIYNSGTMTLVNSSFYDNYVQTGTLRDSEEGQRTGGGAIYSPGNLTIRADNGQSIFRGNKVIWGDGEDSSAIMATGITLDSVNGGLIQFDDKISGMSQTMSKDDVDAMLATIPPEFEVKQDGDNYIVLGTIDGRSFTYHIIKQADGSYTMISGEMSITGDDSSKVVFNNAIENMGTIDISGTNVDVNEGAGTISRTVTHDGGVLNINSGAKAEDSVINDGGRMNVVDKANHHQQRRFVERRGASQAA